MNSIRLTTTCLSLLLLFSHPLACNPSPQGSESEPRISITLATTTSTDNSGLLAAILPAFTKRTRIAVKVIAVGTGKAMKLAENGDVDVVLVHARSAEDRFVERGLGINRRDVMHNDFVIVGPKEDPAGIKEMKDAARALAAIASSGSSFLSRGDDSGTHKKEVALWAAAGLAPQGEWYVSAGQGMGRVLMMANEKRSYCLTDRGTYIAMQDKFQLPILVEGDKRLANPYGVIAVNPAKHTHVKYVEAMAFIGFLTSLTGQKLIGEFTKNDQVLFYPDAVPIPVNDHS